jgi:hypothetical protein
VRIETNDKPMRRKNVLAEIDGLHKGCSIAILGPGNSIEDYQGKEDVAIAMNSAILLDSKIDYFAAFDIHVPQLPYFTVKPEVTRLLGGTITMLCPYTWTDIPLKYRRRLVTMHMAVGQAGIPSDYQPNAPHGYWYFKYEVPRAPKQHTRSLTAYKTIFFPTLEIAYLMGAKQINIYGCDLGECRHWNTDEKLVPFPEDIAPIANKYLRMIAMLGIDIGVSRSPYCKIDVGRSL